MNGLTTGKIILGGVTRVWMSTQGIGCMSQSQCRAPVGYLLYKSHESVCWHSRFFAVSYYFLSLSAQPIDSSIIIQISPAPRRRATINTTTTIITMAPTVLHLRAETKPLEHRSALTPSTTKALIDAGYVVHVEKGSGEKSGTTRIFKDAEFEAVGAKIVEEESWVDAPKEHIIIGLKELREESFPLKHVHVQFAHCYKGQESWDTVLARFPRGGGTLLDLEFLEDPNTKRRVAAFGYHAGFAGAALALENWGWQQTHGSEPLPSVSSYPNEDELIADVKKALAEGEKKAGRKPRVIVIGALGKSSLNYIEKTNWGEKERKKEF